MIWLIALLFLIVLVYGWGLIILFLVVNKLIDDVNRVLSSNWFPPREER